MEQIDYACGIDCPDGADDEQMLMDYIIRDDCELLLPRYVFERDIPK